MINKQHIINLLSRFLGFIVKIMPPAVIAGNLKNIILKLEKYNNSFCTFHLRPKKESGMKMSTNRDYSDIGIVIQGPLIIENDFTLQTVKIYKNLFKSINIVISTWNDTCKEYLENFKNENIEIALNEKPALAGALNSNYQIKSTLNGILLLEKKGIKYVLKTRADQRIYNYQSIDLMLSLINKHPSGNDNLEKRIVSINLTTLKYRPYALGDMCMFGTFEDMKKFWDINLDQRNTTREDIKDLKINELAKLNLGETFYCVSFLNRINIETKLSINNSWKIFRDIFIVVDHVLFDLFWYKYDRETEHRHLYYSPNTFELFKYVDWLQNDTLEEITEKTILNLKDGSTF